MYLSYFGNLATTWEQRLEGLKRAAQSQDDKEKALAQVRIGDHLFEVSGKGYPRFPYVLIDNCFHIQLSGTASKSLLLAHIQLSSELLTSLSVEDAEKKLRYIINTLGLVIGNATISRVDLFADFTTPLKMDGWDHSVWVTRAHTTAEYHERRQSSGWVIGRGGAIGARLYDKTIELTKSKKDYLKPLWVSEGWDQHSTVWRFEFQYRREAFGGIFVLNWIEVVLLTEQNILAHEAIRVMRTTIAQLAGSATVPLATRLR